MSHNGQENGRLKIPYSQFVEWGISRRSIPAAIKYAVEAGFLDVPKRGYHLKDTMNEYRLTYFATRERVRGTVDEWSAPTNEWKRRAGKSFFDRAECDTDLGQNVTLTEGAGMPQTAETLEPDLGQNVTLSSIFSASIPAPARRLAVPPGAVRQKTSKTSPLKGAEKIGASATSTKTGILVDENTTVAITAGGRR
jgi:hypothetical protein